MIKSVTDSTLWRLRLSIPKIQEMRLALLLMFLNTKSFCQYQYKNAVKYVKDYSKSSTEPFQLLPQPETTEHTVYLNDFSAFSTSVKSISAQSNIGDFSSFRFVNIDSSFVIAKYFLCEQKNAYKIPTLPVTATEQDTAILNMPSK